VKLAENAEDDGWGEDEEIKIEEPPKVVVLD